MTEEDFAQVLEAEKEAWAAGRGKLGLSGEEPQTPNPLPHAKGIT